MLALLSITFVNKCWIEGGTDQYYTYANAVFTAMVKHYLSVPISPHLINVYFSPQELIATPPQHYLRQQVLAEGPDGPVLHMRQSRLLGDSCGALPLNSHFTPYN